MDTPKKLPTIKSLILETWETYISRFNLWRWFIFWQIILLGLQQVITETLDFALPVEMLFFSFILVTGVFLSSWLSIGVILGTVEDQSFTNLMSKARLKLGQYFRQILIIFLVEIGGFALFVIPGIFLAVALSFVGVVLVLENISGFNAIYKSREYVRGYWWKVFSRMFVIGVPTLLLLAAFFIIGKDYQIIFNALQIALSAFLFPLEIIYIVKLYQQLKNVGRSPQVEISRRFRILIRLCFFLGIIIAGISLLATSFSR